ncbi:MAG: hypothetical protein AB8B48_08645 [Pseudomonadales bacterium]
MITITEFDIEPDTHLVRRLLFLLIISAIVHGVSLSVLRGSHESAVLPPALPIALSMVKSQAEQYPIETEAQLNEPIKKMTQATPTTHRKNTVTSAPAPEKVLLIKQMDYAAPLDFWQSATCNSRQKRTAGHVCSHENEITEHRYKGAHEQYLAKLVRDERLLPAERATDLRTIDGLLAQQAAVDDALSNFDKPPAHLLIEQRRISSEIARIDNKYSSINLLKLLGSAYKTTTKIVKSGSNSK